jgi:hypothetical protein
LIYLKRFEAGGLGFNEQILAQLNKSLLALSKKCTLDDGTLQKPCWWRLRFIERGDCYEIEAEKQRLPPSWIVSCGHVGDMFIVFIHRLDMPRRLTAYRGDHGSVVVYDNRAEAEPSQQS